MSTIRFVTLHPAGANVDLTKDEGQIPFFLCSKHNVDATLVTCHIAKSANLEYVHGLKVKHFPLIINYFFTGVFYIIFNAKKIDWLNIYFAGRQAYLWSKLYKILNPRGHVYLKLDMDFRSCDLYDQNVNERKIFTKNSEIVDIISVESVRVKQRIQKYSSKDILLIRDGFAQLPLRQNILQPRDNIFITVGRLGTLQKGTDVLLEAFAQSASQHDWQLKLIGNIDENFNAYLKDYFFRYPFLKNRICFVGQITDRKELYNEYCRAKVFIFPSRWESFGISAVEALSCGCRLILSDSIPPANEMTCEGRFGKIFESENIDMLAEEITKETQLKYSLKHIVESSTYADELFSWSKITDILFSEMQKIDKEGL